MSVGFGLRCNPSLHQVVKTAGIKDISAKVWGSRNPVNSVKVRLVNGYVGQLRELIQVDGDRIRVGCV